MFSYDMLSPALGRLVSRLRPPFSYLSNASRETQRLAHFLTPILFSRLPELSGVVTRLELAYIYQDKYLCIGFPLPLLGIPFPQTLLLFELMGVLHLETP